MIGMYRLFTALLFSFIVITLQAENPISIKDFLNKYYIFKDSNPIWQEDADRVNSLFQQILNKDYKESNKDELLTRALDLVYENSMDSFEDAVDIKRMSVRRSMSYATVALIADENKFRSFLEDAGNNLQPLRDVPALHEQHLMLDLIYLFKVEEFLGNEDWEYQVRMKEIKAYLEKYKDEIEETEFYRDFILLIK